MPRERITSAMLGDAVAALNRELGRQPGTPGAYGILGAYVGSRRGRHAGCCGGSGVHAWVLAGLGRHARRAVYDAVQAIRHGLALGRQANAPADAVAVHVARADADTPADALYTAAERAASDASERDDHLAKECENAEDPETAAGVRECVAALDRLADAIAAAVRQEGPAQ